MRIRAYEPNDREACLRILDSNVPEYFLASDRDEVATFLDDLERLGVRYFVVEDDAGKIVACGGVGVDDSTKDARLCWGMVERARHRQGIGRMLLVERLRAAMSLGAKTASLATISKVEGFFAHEGFTFTSGEDDHYAPGMHRRDYRIVLDEETLSRLA
jgi:N-acetylglutamate synthase-like GNAT family acetyltransferase